MDADRIKEFFLNHLEKIILVVFVGLSGYCVYAGIQKPSVLDSHQPDKLIDDAKQVKQSVDDDHTDAVIEERISEFDIVAQTKKIDSPVDPTLYPVVHLWEDIDATTVVRRSDPQLLPPVDLQMYGIATIIAGKVSSPDSYPLTLLEEADEVEKVEKKKRPKRKRRRGGMMSEEMMMGSMGMGMMEESMMMDAMMGGGMGGSMTAAGAKRKLDKAQDESGYRPVPDKDNYPAPQVGWFISGTALLPYKNIYEAYESALRDAKGYDPIRRDTPNFYDLQVQRADVTDKSVDQLVEADWKLVWNRVNMLKLAAGRWRGFAPELVPADYRDPALTMVVPPILLDNYQWFTSHPAIPLKTKKELKAEKRRQENEANQVEERYELDDDTIVLAGPGQRGGMGSSMGMPMDFGAADMQMMTGGMGGMMGAMMGRGVVEVDPVEHKLIRFYDFAGFGARSPTPGRTYVYRIRYGVVDPNFPASPQLQPTTATLTPNVAQRVLGLVAKAEAEKDRGTLFVRYGEWSAPSPPTGLPSLATSYAGPVSAGRMLEVTAGNRKFVTPRDPPTAEVVATVLEPTLGTRVPLTLSVTAGSVLGGKAESADVIDPVSLEIKKLEGPVVDTGITVVDIAGGQPMAADPELTTPGMMLLMDAGGSLQVADSIDQQRPFRTYSFADEKGK